MKNSLRSRALIFVFIILSVVLGANTVFLSWKFASFEKNSLQYKTKILGEHLREKLARALNIGLPLESLEGVNDSCREITEENKEIGYCMVVGPDGRIIYHNDPLIAGRFSKDDDGAEPRPA